MKQLRLENVRFMPEILEEGVLYYSQEFEVASHLCACGCKSEVITPIDPVEWSISSGSEGVSLEPSIGNWQLPCKSHYWIRNGRVEWASAWTLEEIQFGDQQERLKRSLFYEDDTSFKKSSSIRTRFISFITVFSLRVLNWYSKVIK